MSVQGSISIIVPIYNAEHYLDRCIESVIGQSYQQWELLLINDGSKDQSLSICRNYANKDKRIRVIDQENTGVSGAKNRGLTEAGGEYLIFLDSDDYMDLEMLEQLFAPLKEKDYDLVICGFYRHDMMEGNTVVTNYHYRAAEYRNFISEEAFADLYQKPLLNQNWNKLYKLSIIKEKGITFQKGFSLGEDLLFNLKVFRHCQSVKVIENCLYHYICENQNSLSQKYREDFFEIQTLLWRQVKAFIMDTYPGKAEALLCHIDKNYVQTSIGCLILISKQKAFTFSQRQQAIKKILYNEELHNVTKRTAPISRKMGILQRLVVWKCSFLLGVILRRM